MGVLVAAAAAADPTVADRIEMLDWSDPERAVQLIGALTLAERQMPDPQTLEILGMVYADVHRDADVEATLARLRLAAERGEKSAFVAEH
jgi:hypothetical protein